LKPISEPSQTKGTPFLKKEKKKKRCRSTYRIRAAEKSGLLKVIPVLYLVNDAEAVSNPTSPPKLTSSLPMEALTSKIGVGFKLILEFTAVLGLR